MKELITVKGKKEIYNINIKDRVLASKDKERSVVIELLKTNRSNYSYLFDVSELHALLSLGLCIEQDGHYWGEPE